jgi:putative tricarboxylic transport membrane protein
MNHFTRKGDFWSGLALAALGVYILSQAFGWSYMDEDGPGPGFFPRWYGALMVALSLLLVAGAVLKNDPRSPSPKWSEMRRAMVCWMALVACVAAMKYLGFIVSFGALTWFIVAIMFRRPQTVALSLAVGGAVGFYALFVWVMEMRLPVGTLFEKLMGW